ncbi:MAG: pyridoxamine 5'-phosphate oxidase family protein [candidate division KSB1 bacterium]|nr:pyridoxamine 5'-phosphate oxidase family protein [candidate division KSB1 bacterium]
MKRTETLQTDRPYIERIIAEALVCRVASAVENRPYLVPLSFGYDGEAFYFHTGLSGTKIDFWSRNSRVCFELEGSISVKEGEKACDWTMIYESVIGFGIMSEIIDPSEKTTALNEIMRHYSAKTGLQISAETAAKTRVWKLTVEEMTAKSNEIIPYADDSAVS